MKQGLRAVTVVALALPVLGSSAAAASAAPHPSRPSAHIIPTSSTHLPATGGKVTFDISVWRAHNCAIVWPDGEVSRFTCAGQHWEGTGGPATFDANEATTPFTGTVLLRAFDRFGHKAISQMVITEAASPVEGLDWCTNDTVGCDLGPLIASFPTYGNVYPAELGDCTFAAAADWEIVKGFAPPDAATIGYEFAQAGGSATDGLTEAQLQNYWESSGIAGVVISGVAAVATDEADLEAAVSQYGAVMAGLQLFDNGYLGYWETSASYHEVVVDGFTPEGPIVVTWGQTAQMTWQQWTAEAQDAWAPET
jgi:hypothetical protein